MTEMFSEYGSYLNELKIVDQNSFLTKFPFKRSEMRAIGSLKIVIILSLMSAEILYFHSFFLKKYFMVI